MTMRHIYPIPYFIGTDTTNHVLGVFFLVAFAAPPHPSTSELWLECSLRVRCWGTVLGDSDCVTVYEQLAEFLVEGTFVYKQMSC